MDSRIRYSETSDGIFKSKRIFESKRYGSRYRVVLDMNEKIYKIINTNDRRIVKKGGENINNVNTLKRAARSALMSLGVMLEPEVREMSETQLKALEEAREKRNAEYQERLRKATEEDKRSNGGEHKAEDSSEGSGS
jgi:hypothetical protein